MLRGLSIVCLLAVCVIAPAGAVAQVDDGQTFDRRVACSAPSGHFDMWQSPALSADLFGAGAAISGTMRVTSVEPVERFQASVGLGLRQQEFDGKYIKLSFEPCSDGKQVCSRLYQVDPDLPRERAFTDLPAPKAVFRIGEPIAVSIKVASQREWTISYGAHVVRVAPFFDATVVSFSCVGAAGTANFEPSGLKIS